MDFESQYLQFSGVSGQESVISFFTVHQ